MGAKPDASNSSLRVTPTLTVPFEEIEWRATVSGGPGGQHANRRSTRVEVRFDAAASPSLGPRQRARVVDRLGPVVRATAGESRSQARNREVALERLRAKLAGALRRQKTRIRTAPSAAARQRRLNEKRMRSERKRSRRVSPDD